MRRHPLPLLAALLLASPARADPADDALVDAGLELRRQGHDLEALEQFRRAFALRAAPRTLAQIAFAEQAVGDWVDAERDALKALRAADDPWIEEHDATLRAALALLGQHLGTLEVQSNLTETELRLNGVLVGKLPLPPFRVSSGQQELELRHDGYSPVRRVLQVPVGGAIAEHIEFVAAPPLPTAHPTTAVGPPRQHEPFGPSRPMPPQRAFAWGTMGGAVVVLSAAVVAQLEHQRAATHYNDDKLCLYGSLSRDERCGAYRGEADTMQTLADIGYVTAGAFGLTSAILFLLPIEDAHAGLTIGASSTSAEIAWRGTM